jgi:hypothetical protein
MKLHKYTLLACSVFCFSFMQVANATDGISCNGTIDVLGVHGTDRVILKLSGMNKVVQICHLNNTIGSTYPITPEQCRMAYSTLMTAYSLGKTINVWFDNVQTGTSCSTFKAWEIATARWVHLDAE